MVKPDESQPSAPPLQQLELPAQSSASPADPEPWWKMSSADMMKPIVDGSQHAPCPYPVENPQYASGPVYYPPPSGYYAPYQAGAAPIPIHHFSSSNEFPQHYPSPPLDPSSHHHPQGQYSPSAPPGHASSSTLSSSAITPSHYTSSTVVTSSSSRKKSRKHSRESAMPSDAIILEEIQPAETRQQKKRRVRKKRVKKAKKVAKVVGIVAICVLAVPLVLLAGGAM
ncbi:MAG: hypothetical protein Q8P67_18285 [archaeon]|nr:hypothetical protein [archaeon]